MVEAKEIEMVYWKACRLGYETELSLAALKARSMGFEKVV